MKTRYLRFLLSFVLCGFYAFSANSASSVFSNYGQIQNVQNYSTNPFWTPSSPYNQRLPQPVYVQGADLTADDCFKVVQSLVSVQCMARDNCKDTSLSDIRPSIMVQLSNLPGANYVSACSGYIDGVYESYVAQFGGNVPNRQVAFPTATVPNQNLNNNNFQIKNPYEVTPPQWQQEINERTQELQELQEENGADSEQLSATAFPETYADLSFTERMANATAGYEPFAGKSAYVIPDFQTESEYCPSHLDDPACAAYKEKSEKEQSKEDAKEKKKSIRKSNAEGIDYFMPWFGILVVKKGSLDDVAKSAKPFISTTEMKANKAKYYPDNSNKVLGLAKGCTHGNHTANDKDVINRAGHITMDDGKDSFFTGNDYYVYDGEDVYWGTAVLVGEIALAILTLGASAEAQSGLTSAKVAGDIKDVGASVKAVEVVKDTKKVQDAARAASAISKTSSAAEKASAIAKLKDAGITVSSKAGYLQLQKIGSILTTAKQNTGWVSALVHGNKWRLVKEGVKNIVPTTKKIFSNGASIGRNLATTALILGGTSAAVSLSDTVHNMFIAFLKANGYSSASMSITDDPQYKDLKFNSFGLLSADDIEGHENDVSHGTWIKFDEVGESYSGDGSNPGAAEEEATRFAQEFAQDVRNVNQETPLCDIDIYVVRPVIGDPFNKGKPDIYYLLYTDPTVEADKPLRVESK